MTGAEEWVGGLYDGAIRVPVRNFTASEGEIRKKLFHEYTHVAVRSVTNRCPTWLNEGLGSLYGSAVRTKKGFRFLVNYRLRHLRKALKAGLLPDLDELANSTRQDVYGLNSLAYYSLSRYVLLYLEHRGKLDEFIGKLRQGNLTPGRQLKILSEFVDYDAFIKWTKKLRIKPKGRS